MNDKLEVGDRVAAAWELVMAGLVIVKIGTIGTVVKNTGKEVSIKFDRCGCEDAGITHSHEACLVIYTDNSLHVSTIRKVEQKRISLWLNTPYCPICKLSNFSALHPPGTQGAAWCRVCGTTIYSNEFTY
jgi:hypothetical protein